VALPNGIELSERNPTSAIKAPDSLCNLSPTAQKSFEAASRVVFYPASAILFAEAQPPRGVYLLRAGRVKLAMTSAEGKSIILRVAGPGELLGLGAAVSGKAHELTAEALEPCQVDFLQFGSFRRLLQERAEFSIMVIEQLSRDYSSACSQVRTLGLCRKASEKVARFLLIWASHGGTAATLPLTHEEIAQALGLTRETVTRTLAEFKHKKLIAMVGPDLVICNKPALQSLIAA
jgi:CRP/FNR family transcriptional regulator, cyclic AMP receptor protein